MKGWILNSYICTFWVVKASIGIHLRRRCCYDIHHTSEELVAHALHSFIAVSVGLPGSRSQVQEGEEEGAQDPQERNPESWWPASTPRPDGWAHWLRVKVEIS